MHAGRRPLPGHFRLRSPNVSYWFSKKRKSITESPVKDWFSVNIWWAHPLLTALRTKHSRLRIRENSRGLQTIGSDYRSGSEVIHTAELRKRSESPDWGICCLLLCALNQPVSKSRQLWSGCTVQSSPVQSSLDWRSSSSNWRLEF